MGKSETRRSPVGRCSVGGFSGKRSLAGVRRQGKEGDGHGSPEECSGGRAGSYGNPRPEGLPEAGRGGRPWRGGGGWRWRYLYREVDGTGQTIDFLLSAKRDKKAAKRFFRKALARDNTRNPRTIVTDRLKSYPGALREMKRDGELWRFTRHRRGRWLNNLVEQDHRRVKRRTRPMLGFESFVTARRTLAGVEAMAMLAKGQVCAVPANDTSAQRAFVHRLFGLAA